MNNPRNISIVLLLGILGCNETDKNKFTASNTKDRQINLVKLEDLNHQAVDPDNFKGKTVFINFWATWCKPCIEEMPSIEKAKNLIGNQNVVFLLASNESADLIMDFRREHTYKLDYVKVENMEELNIQALPTTFIYNAEGKLIFSETGYRKWDDSKNLEVIRKIIK